MTEPMRNKVRAGTQARIGTMEQDKNAISAFSILDLHERERKKGEIPAYFQDLNLETVLDLLAMNGGKSTVTYYRYLPETPEDEAYRRAVYGDVKKEPVNRALEAFVSQMGNVKDLRRKKENAPAGLQQAVWLLREEEAYCIACESLMKALEQAELSSAGMRQFFIILRDWSGGETFQRMRRETNEIMSEIRELRLVITYEKNRVRVELKEDGREIETPAQRDGKILQNPFSAGAALVEMERECLEILKKKKPDLFRAVLDTSKRFESYENPTVARFEKEIKFYLSYCSLQTHLESKGFSFSTPNVSENRALEGKGLYDLALACVSVNSGKKVVSNDFYYGNGERFFVLTGPNQGGKTTFARSLGQLVYFARIGLDVPAREANVPFFPDIQTHFSVEESLETGRGKLKEELTRLAPMMEGRQKGTFVVINELFTTAANYDAQMMGRKVLEHFIELGCMGIYVTHLKELASAHTQAVSLRAMLDENKCPTYQIRRGEAAENASAEKLVEKHRLTYRQLKERL